jgi:hypothetical protein
MAERDKAGVPAFVLGPILTPVDGNFEPSQGGPEARAEIDMIALEKQGAIRLVFDVGIEGSEGSWVFAIEARHLFDYFLQLYLEPDRKAVAEVLARALEMEASRVRWNAAEHECL